MEATIPNFNEEGMILSSMTDEEKRLALAVASEKLVSKGTTLISQGDDINQLYLVREGLAKVCLYTASGREIILDYIGPGQLVGELSFFDGHPSSASVITIQSCKIAIFHRPDLMAFLEKNGAIAIRIIQILCSRVRKTNQLIESDRSFSMGPKLARGILRLLQDHGGETHAGNSIQFAISQGDLGNFVSLSRENVNRQLRDWQAEGVIEIKAGKITVLDFDYLDEIATFGE